MHVDLQRNRDLPQPDEIGREKEKRRHKPRLPHVDNIVSVLNTAASLTKKLPFATYPRTVNMIREAGSSRPSNSLKPSSTFHESNQDNDDSRDYRDSQSDSEEEDPYPELGNSLNGNRKGKGVAYNGYGSPSSPSRQPDPRPPTKREQESRSWSDLDLSLVVALVSPVGNWLTGSDHVKNLFLIALLIFYLHQLIEMPWRMYHASRPRKGSRFTSNLPDEAGQNPLVRLAHSELRAHELFYLSMTVLSPFLGAYLIRYLLTSLEGVDNLSWFSTTLFVLATGIRPWSHLISRLTERTQDLHDAIHYPSENSIAHQSLELNLKLKAVMDRLDSLESHLGELEERHEKIAGVKEVCDELSEAVGDIERTLGKQEKKMEGSRTAQDARFTALERKLGQLEDRRKKDREFFETAIGRSPIPYASYAKTVASTLYQVPEAIAPYVPYVLKQAWFWPKPNTRPTHISLRHSNSLRHHGDLVSSPGAFPNVSPTFRLETILEHEGEEEHNDELDGEIVRDSDSEGTYVSDEPGLNQSSTALSPKSKARRLSRSRSRSITRKANQEQTYYSYLSTKAVDYGFAVVAWPYRAATGILVMVLPPLRKAFP